MKKIKDARGEVELQPKEHVPGGPIQIRSAEWKSLLIECRDALADLGALKVRIENLRTRVEKFES